MGNPYRQNYQSIQLYGRNFYTHKSFRKIFIYSKYRRYILGNEFVSSGYKANNWYGLEIECAYDPSLNTQSLANFEIRGWAVNKIKTTGMAQTSGDITGTIVMNTTNISNFNFNLANTFNNSKTSIAVNQEGFINTVSKEIENGITKKDSFGKYWKQY